jgi:isopenicillin-N N-acyltransferase-like protein
MRRESIAATVETYRALFRSRCGLEPDAWGTRTSSFATHLASTAPTALAEIYGIADGAGLARVALLAVNARTEILAGSGAAECSVIGATARRTGGTAILAQNWDWYPDAASTLVLWNVALAGGRWLTTLTEAGMLAKIGMNDRGLAIAINILDTPADATRRVGLPIHVLLRVILERCGGLGDVRRLLHGVRLAASTAITVAAGEAFRTFEVSPTGVRELGVRDGVVLHTNHVVSGAEAVGGPPGDRPPGDIPPADTAESVGRLDRLRQLSAVGTLDADRVAAILRDHEAHICRHREFGEGETLASVVMDLGGGSIAVADGPPCRAPYAAYPVVG